MNDVLWALWKPALALLAVTQWICMGLSFDSSRASEALRNSRFVLQSLGWAYLAGPLLGFLLSQFFGLRAPYALGLTLLALAPVAHSLPDFVGRARGDLHYAQGLMLLTAAGTVVLLPLIAPWVHPGFEGKLSGLVRAVTVYILLPWTLGQLFHRVWPAVGSTILKRVSSLADMAAVLVVWICLVHYGRDFVEEPGFVAVTALFIFLVVMTAGAFGLVSGFPPGTRSVLSLGMGTRNVGAALAPLLVLPDADQRAIAFVTTALPLQVLISSASAFRFSRAKNPLGL